jgi:hypothetical protein
MSAILNAVGTLFTSVASTAVNVGSAIMGVGASMFTAGASGAAGSALSGTLGNVVTGALTQAAIGAVVGGGMSMLSGGSFGKGAMMGALGGAVSGGLMGAAGMGTNPFAEGFGQVAGGTDAAYSKMPPSSVDPGANAVLDAGGGPLPVRMDGSADMGGGSAVAKNLVKNVSDPAGGGEKGGGFLSAFNDKGTIGQIIGGAAEGYGAYLKAEEARKAAAAGREHEVALLDRRTNSYRGMPQMAAPNLAQGNPTPEQKFGGRPRYAWDPEQGRVVLG